MHRFSILTTHPSLLSFRVNPDPDSFIFIFFFTAPTCHPSLLALLTHMASPSDCTDINPLVYFKLFSIRTTHHALLSVFSFHFICNSSYHKTAINKKTDTVSLLSAAPTCRPSLLARQTHTASPSGRTMNHLFLFFFSVSSQLTPRSSFFFYFLPLLFAVPTCRPSLRALLTHTASPSGRTHIHPLFRFILSRIITTYPSFLFFPFVCSADMPPLASCSINAYGQLIDPHFPMKILTHPAPPFFFIILHIIRLRHHTS